MTLPGVGRKTANVVLGDAFGVVFQWTEARRSEHVVFGPRFAIYPAVVPGPGGSVSFSPTLGVIEDANSIDALARLALSTLEVAP